MKENVFPVLPSLLSSEHGRAFTQAKWKSGQPQIHPRIGTNRDNLKKFQHRQPEN